MTVRRSRFGKQRWLMTSPTSFETTDEELFSCRDSWKTGPSVQSRTLCRTTMAQICFDVDVSGTGWNCHSSSVHIGRHFRRWKELEDWLNYHRKGVISVIACFGNDYMCKWWYVCLLVEYGYQITKAESKIVSWLIDVQLFHCPSFVNQSRRGKLFGVSGR